MKPLANRAAGERIRSALWSHRSGGGAARGRGEDRGVVGAGSSAAVADSGCEGHRGPLPAGVPGSSEHGDGGRGAAAIARWPDQLTWVTDAGRAEVRAVRPKGGGKVVKRSVKAQ